MRLLRLALVAAVAALVLLVAAPALAKTGKGLLYHDGDTVRTVVVPAALPNGGSDPFYAVMDGAEGQLGIAGLAPGDPGYTGGDWAFHAVTFVEGVEPSLLTSEEAVMTAEAAGDVVVVRIPANDFRCPVLP